MPTWTNKDERQYEYIKESLEQKGNRPEKASEIAARTVNKHRRLEGRTPNKITQGTGNPTTRLEERTRAELYNRAKMIQISNRSRMSKGELIDAIRSAR